MPILNVTVDLSDVEKCDWESVLKSARRSTVDAYGMAFTTASNDLKVQGKDTQAAALALLGAVCSIMLVPRDENGPYLPVGSGPHFRTALPEDLSEAELDILAHVFNSSDEPEFRSRLGDILWLRKRDYKAAREATLGYMVSAQRLESEGQHVHVPVRFQRAVQLAAQLGGGRGDLLNKLLEEITAIVRSRVKAEVKPRSLDVIDLLIDHDSNSSVEWAAISEQFAILLEGRSDYHLALRFWARAARAHRKADNKEATRNALIQEAEGYVKLADNAPREMAKVSFIRSAFEAYRQIPDTKQRRDELHKRLLQHQKLSLAEMGTIQTPINLGEIPQHAREFVKGKSLLEALYALAIVQPPIKLDELRKQVEVQEREAPLSFIMSSEKVNTLGKVVGVKPASSDHREGAIRSMMHDDANRLHKLSVLGVIEPARQQILAEYANPQTEDIEPLVSHNAFIPPERHLLFSRGLLAGLRGDFLVSAHLLIPQVENSLRVVLQRMGILTTGLDSSTKRQNEQSLNVTLFEYLEDLEQIFGKDVVFELQNLLVEPMGANLRNEIMHGLVSDGAFFSSPVAYLWWLTLRLCCLGNQGPIPEGFSRSGESFDPAAKNSTDDDRQ